MTTGTLDTSFGTNGKVVVSVPTLVSETISQPDGKIIASIGDR